MGREALTPSLLTSHQVIFISHQWNGWLHPDTKLEQMRSLKAALRLLLEGHTTVRSNAILEMAYGWFIAHSGERESTPFVALALLRPYRLARSPPTLPPAASGRNQVSF